MSGMETIVEVSPRAVKQIEDIQSKSEGSKTHLRLAVVGGGCSGLSYKIEFSEQKETDRVINFEGFSIIIDPKSSIYLKGSTLDYQDGLEGKGFVFTNPNSKNSCGCGESFSV